jgi:uncharacterized membrane protein
MQILFNFCQWLQETNLSTAIRESTFMFPIIEGTHLLGIGVSAGTIALTDLRLLSWIMKKDPASKVMGSLLPFTLGGFVVVFITGGLLFLSEPARSYINPWFRAKLALLVLAAVNALAFHLTIYRSMDKWDNDVVAPTGARLAGALSLVIWATVIWFGRQFAYSH